MGAPETRLIEKALPNKSSVGDVPVNKQNLMDNASITRESATVWESGNVQWICCSQKVLIDWNIVPGIIFQTWAAQQTICHLTQFSSPTGLGNEMKIKSRLPPFSLICIQCQCTFCFWFLNPFTAWPERFLGHTVHAIHPGSEDFRAVDKCTSVYSGREMTDRHTHGS